MRMPDCQNELIDEICKVQENVIVVLHNGSPVEMPWNDNVSAVLEVYLAARLQAKLLRIYFSARQTPAESSQKQYR